MSKFIHAEEIYEDLLIQKGGISSHNIKILKNVISYWFLFLQNFIDEEGKDNLSKLSEIIKETPDNSLPYSVNSYFSGKNNILNINSRKKRTYRIPFFILKILMLIRGYKLVLDKTSLRGGWRLSSYCMALLNRSDLLVVDMQLKHDFIEDLNIRNNFEPDIQKFIEENLPDLLFIKPIRNKKLIKSIEVHSSADMFLNARSPIKLLFITKNLRLIGYQHGINYGQWNKNLYQESEVKVSDEFHLWFPHKPNFIGRFDVNPSLNTSNQTRILWVGRINLHSFYKKMLPYAYEHKMDNSHLEIIDNSFHCLDNFSFYKPGRVESVWLPDKSIVVRDGPIENYINLDRDVLLFDNISETTIFLALKYRVPFLIILKNKKIKGLTSKYEEFLEILNSNNFLYNIDEINEAKKLLLDISISRDLYKEKKSLINSLIVK